MTKIAIDAGHGSQTAGKRTPDGYREHWINVKTAYYLEQALQKKGIQTIRVGWNDTNATDDADISLTARQKQIKSAKCDYSVSCHANAYGDGKTYNSAQGVSTHIHNNSACLNDSYKFAQHIQNRLVDGTKQKDKGVIKQALAMCNCKTMGTKASCLVEIGFMTNKVEADLMKTESFCREQGEDIARGIFDYLGISVDEIKAASKTELAVEQFEPTKGDMNDFAEIIKNIKTALNVDYGLQFVIDSSINGILLTNLGNIILSTGAYKQNITYALQQLFMWWGYDIVLDGVYGNDTKATVTLFQSQTGIARTGTTTTEFWWKILGK